MEDVPLEVRTKGLEMLSHFCCVLIDSLFLCLWAVTNFGANLAVRTYFPRDGTDAFIGIVLQGLFGLATLAPIAISLYRDIRVMWIRANQKIADEKVSKAAVIR